jgi:hypothetical protein
MIGRVLAWVLVVAAATATGAGERVRIVEPGPDRILYGRTRIVAGIERATPVREVRFFLDRYPQPICTTTEAPHVCEFDAGTSFQGRTIVVRAYEDSGEVLGGDAVATLAFPRPERVVHSTLTVPVVATTGADATGLADAAWTCRYGEEPCSVARARKLYDAAEPRVSIDVLVDVSPSVQADRAELERALRFVLDRAGPGVEIAVAEFAGVYHRLVPYTSDRDVLHDSLGRMAEAVSYTCLADSIRLSLAGLQARPGHRILFVISDTQEYCQIAHGYTPPASTSRTTEAGEPDPEKENRASARASAPMGGGGGGGPRVSKASLEGALETSRLSGIPIYIYRVGEVEETGGTSEVFDRLADESGARVFDHADFAALGDALERLVDDLESTWLVEVDLAAGAATGEDRLLSLAVDGGASGLRYQRLWRGGNRDSVLAAMLEMGDAGARYWAASQLIDSVNRDILDTLIETFEQEDVAHNRVMEISALFNMTASLLLHGDVEDQKAALGVVERLHEIHPVLIRRLRPALEVYQKTDPPRKLLKRARRAYRRAPARNTPSPAERS